VSKEVKDLQAKLSALEKQTNEMKNAPKEKLELPPDVSKEVKDLQAKLSALEKQTNEMKNAPKEKLELPPDVSKEVKEIQDKLSNVDTINNRINDMNDTIQNLEGLVISNDKKIEDELQRARISLRNEQAENERLFKKNIQDTLNHRSQSVPRLRRGNSSLNTSPTPIPRRSEIDNDRMDTHRVMELPMFSAELFDNKVIKGGSPNLLLDGDEWNITCDNKNGFDEGRYICPNAGAYDVRLLCKTLSTSVTARITLYHMNDSGNILRAYAMDQSNIVNEHCAVVRIAHAEEGDSFTLWVENRFNIALKGVEKVVDDSNKEGYDLVSTMCQIVYNPARGYCET
jgi:hypothetical protein